MKWVRKGSENDFEPIFVVGHPRSGTTLVASILDRHSAIASTPETHFGTTILPRLRASSHLEPRELVTRLGTSTQLRDMGIDLSKVTARLAQRNEIDPAFLFRSFLEQFAAERRKPRVAEKTPVHVRCLPLLESWYPKAKFIWVVRDARDAILSLKELDWASSNEWRLGFEWLRNVCLALDFERRRPDGIRRLHFESLLNDPVGELEGLHAFLGLRFEPGQLDPSIPPGVIPEWEESWKSKARQSLDPTRAHAWRRDARSSEICRINAVTGHHQARLGYPDTGVADCGMPARMVSALVALGASLVFSGRVYPAIDGLYRLAERARE